MIDQVNCCHMSTVLTNQEGFLFIFKVEEFQKTFLYFNYNGSNTTSYIYFIYIKKSCFLVGYVENF